MRVFYTFTSLLTFFIISILFFLIGGQTIYARHLSTIDQATCLGGLPDTAYSRAQFDHYGSNFCCATGQSADNVCNNEYYYEWNTDCSDWVGPNVYITNNKHGCWDLGTTCAVCQGGDTQTETQYVTSCMSSTCGNTYPSTPDYCARYVLKQERTRTCASDCGSWGSWGSWATVDEYSECPSSSTACGTKTTSGSTCYVDPSCNESQCSAWTNSGGCGTGGCTSNQKPQTRTCAQTSCSTSKCNLDSSCGGGGGGGGGTSNLYIDPNPVNKGSAVTVIATSDTSCNNTGISPGGGFEMKKADGSDCWEAVHFSGNPKDGKPIWWRWQDCRATNAGSYNATFSGTGSGCSASRDYTVNPAVQILGQIWKDQNGNQAIDTGDTRIKDPNITSCSDASSNYPLDLTINYSGTAGTVSGSTKLTKCQAGGAYYDTTKILPLPAGSSYQVSVSGVPAGWYVPNNPRTVTFNGSGEGHEWFWLNPLPENLNSTLPACNINPPNVNFSWTGTNSILWIDVSTDSSFATYINKGIGNYLAYDTNSIPGLNIVRGTPYYWRLYNGAGHAIPIPPSFNVPNCLDPWIQTIGGDVHSNVKIDMGGGP